MPNCSTARHTQCRSITWTKNLAGKMESSDWSAQSFSCLIGSRIVCPVSNLYSCQTTLTDEEFISVLRSIPPNGEWRADWMPEQGKSARNLIFTPHRQILQILWRLFTSNGGKTFLRSLLGRKSAYGGNEWERRSIELVHQNIQKYCLGKLYFLIIQDKT